jgi:hypothetical protein
MIVVGRNPRWLLFADALPCGLLIADLRLSASVEAED